MGIAKITLHQTPHLHLSDTYIYIYQYNFRLVNIFIILTHNLIYNNKIVKPIQYTINAIASPIADNIRVNTSNSDNWYGMPNSMVAVTV